MNTQVYWIRANHHADITSDGYIGVSKNAKKRWVSGHKLAHQRNKHDNLKFSNAISKYGWNNLIKTIIVIGNKNYCYDIEEKLRPRSNIGWNIAIGGGKPPVSKFRGESYVSPLRGVSRPTPWLVGKERQMPKDFFKKGGMAGKGRKQTIEQIAKRVKARRDTMINGGKIKHLIVNGIQYESSKTASLVLGIPDTTIKYWAYGKGKPSKLYNHIIEVRWL